MGELWVAISPKGRHIKILCNVFVDRARNRTEHTN